MQATIMQTVVRSMRLEDKKMRVASAHNATQTSCCFLLLVYQSLRCMHKSQTRNSSAYW